EGLVPSEKEDWFGTQPERFDGTVQRTTRTFARRAVSRIARRFSSKRRATSERSFSDTFDDVSRTTSSPSRSPVLRSPAPSGLGAGRARSYRRVSAEYRRQLARPFLMPSSGRERSRSAR